MPTRTALLVGATHGHVRGGGGARTLRRGTQPRGARRRRGRNFCPRAGGSVRGPQTTRQAQWPLSRASQPYTEPGLNSVPASPPLLPLESEPCWRAGRWVSAWVTAGTPTPSPSSCLIQAQRRRELRGAVSSHHCPAQSLSDLPCSRAKSPSTPRPRPLPHPWHQSRPALPPSPSRLTVMSGLRFTPSGHGKPSSADGTPPSQRQVERRPADGGAGEGPPGAGRSRHTQQVTFVMRHSSCGPAVAPRGALAHSLGDHSP